MRLDAPTLMTMTAFVALIVGALFLVSWRQSRFQPHLLYWAGAHLIGGLGSALSGQRALLPFDIAVGGGNAAVIAAYGLFWAGARAFERRRVGAVPILFGPAAWCALWMLPAFQASVGMRVVVASLAAGLYLLLAASEFARGRHEPLASRWPAIVLLVSYGVLYLARIPFAASAAPIVPAPGAPTGQEALATVGLIIMCFAAVLYTVAIAFVFIALSKERSESEQRLAAETDSLTGAVTRRAFVAAAERRLAGSAPAALIVFDLDHFKRVNDTYGHAVGDAVLAGFADAVRTLLPAGAVLARLGGEEFACLADDLDAAAATRFAERVRGCVAAARAVSLPDLAPTVSVGVATTAEGRDFADLMRRADAALYRAKNGGRNRVEFAGRRRAA